MSEKKKEEELCPTGHNDEDAIGFLRSAGWVNLGKLGWCELPNHRSMTLSEATVTQYKKEYQKLAFVLLFGKDEHVNLLLELAVGRIVERGAREFLEALNRDKPAGGSEKP